MTEYKLVNPHIEGSFKTLYQGSTPFDAAQKMWSKLSENITNSVPEFAFTIQRVKDNTLFHYKVNETVNNNEVDFTIAELDNKVSNAKKNKFLDKLKQFKSKVQEGGKRRRRKKNDDDDDDSSTDSDYYYDLLKQHSSFYNQPITYYWYYPELYTFEYDYVFVPSWASHLSPLNLFVI